MASLEFRSGEQVPPPPPLAAAAGGASSSSFLDLFYDDLLDRVLGHLTRLELGRFGLTCRSAHGAIWNRPLEDGRGQSLGERLWCTLAFREWNILQQAIHMRQRQPRTTDLAGNVRIVFCNGDRPSSTQEAPAAAGVSPTCLARLLADSTFHPQPTQVTERDDEDDLCGNLLFAHAVLPPAFLEAPQAQETAAAEQGANESVSAAAPVSAATIVGNNDNNSNSNNNNSAGSGDNDSNTNDNSNKRKKKIETEEVVVPIVRFEGQVGPGDRCVRSPYALPRPIPRPRQEGEPPQTRSKAPQWTNAIVAPFVSEDVTDPSTGIRQVTVNVTPRFMAYYEVTVLPPMDHLVEVPSRRCARGRRLDNDNSTTARRQRLEDAATASHIRALRNAFARPPILAGGDRLGGGHDDGDDDSDPSFVVPADDNASSSEDESLEGMEVFPPPAAAVAAAAPIRQQGEAVVVEEEQQQQQQEGNENENENEEQNRSTLADQDEENRMHGDDDDDDEAADEDAQGEAVRVAGESRGEEERQAGGNGVNNNDEEDDDDDDVTFHSSDADEMEDDEEELDSDTDNDMAAHEDDERRRIMLRLQFMGRQLMRRHYANREDCIAIGLSMSPFPLVHKMPGWDRHSFGFHSDDGHIYHGETGSLRRRLFGPQWGVGDVVGMGIDYASRSIFLTVNGQFLGNAWTNLDCLGGQLAWFPTIGLDSGFPITVNFGDRPFAFDLAAYAKLRANASASASTD